MGRRGPQPEHAKREEFAKLIAEGVPSLRASRIVGINPTTGKRWRQGRKVRSGGRVLDLAPVINPRPEKRYSPRYLSDNERIRLADLRREKLSIRAIADLMRRSPSTISRELRAAVTPRVGTDLTKPNDGRSLVVVCADRAGCAETTSCASGSRRS